ncbi:MAG: TraY domain-containing protein [Wenzhouxiangellaceae bacterium]
MLAIRLPEDIEKRLADLAEKTGRTKTWYARQALLEYLDDLEDYYLADSRVDESRMSLEEVERRLGLEN